MTYVNYFFFSTMTCSIFVFEISLLKIAIEVQTLIWYISKSSKAKHFTEILSRFHEHLISNV